MSKRLCLFLYLTELFLFKYTMNGNRKQRKCLILLTQRSSAALAKTHLPSVFISSSLFCPPLVWHGMTLPLCVKPRSDIRAFSHCTNLFTCNIQRLCPKGNGSHVILVVLLKKKKNKHIFSTEGKEHH